MTPLRLISILMSTAGLLLSPCSALAKDKWSKYDRQFSFELVALIRRSTSTREQSAFLDRNKVDLKVEDRSDSSGKSVRGSYDGMAKVMYLDKSFLLQSVWALREIRAKKKYIPGILAWKMLPTVSHELSHGMVHELLEKDLGIAFWQIFLEDEILAYADEGTTLKECFRERGDLWERDMILDTERYALALVRTWDKGMRSIQEYARKKYPSRESVFSASPKDFLAKADRLIKKYEKNLARTAELKKYYESRKAGGSKTAAQSIAKLEEEEKRYLKVLERERPRRDLWSDPKKVKRLREFYKKALNVRAQDMRQAGKKQGSTK